MSNVIVVTSTADSGAGSLRAALAAARMGETTIRFAANLANQAITLTSGQLVVGPGKQITIDARDAAGLQISGNQSSRIFLVNSNQDFPAALSLRNLTLRDGYTSEIGGAIHSTHRGKVSVERVNFENNVADQGGGAICSDWETDLIVINSQFTGNQGIGANVEQGGGAITFTSPGNFVVRNSKFTSNRGTNGGAIHNLNGKLTIQNSEFINNDTTAAYFAVGEERDFLRGYGGAVYVDRASSIYEPGGMVQISNSLFQGNQSRNEGGGAYIYTANGDSVSITDTVFKDNEALPLPTPTSDGAETSGGGLSVMSNGLNQGLTIDRSAFINNTAGGQGGGLWMMGAPTTIRNSTFAKNRVTGTSYSSVGGGMTLYGPTDIINTTIAENFAGWVGGGIAANNETVTLQNSILWNNTAQNGDEGWGILQHVSRGLIDRGRNIQFPPKRTTFFNDANATDSIRLIDPKLGPLTARNRTWLYPLLAGSPAINNGAFSGVTTDQSGAGHNDGLIDIGAAGFGNTLPLVQVNDVRVVEGQVGSAVFTVRLSAASNQTVTVNYRTISQAAQEDVDYNFNQGTVTFNPGQTQQTVRVALRNDRRLEADESFALLLTDPVNASLGKDVGIATITDSLTANVSTTLTAGVEGLDLTGVGNITGTGNSSTNALIGNAGNNSLNGLAGNDLLAGGDGNDRFLFGSGRGYSATDFGLDTIADLTWGDKIALSKTSFTALQSVSGNGFSRPAEFAAVATDSVAASSQALIVYSLSTGTLFYNPNGVTAGYGNGGAFARLSNRFNLQATDFLLQA